METAIITLGALLVFSLVGNFVQWLVIRDNEPKRTLHWSENRLIDQNGMVIARVYKDLDSNEWYGLQFCNKKTARFVSEEQCKTWLEDKWK